MPGSCSRRLALVWGIRFFVAGAGLWVAVGAGLAASVAETVTLHGLAYGKPHFKPRCRAEANPASAPRPFSGFNLTCNPNPPLPCPSPPHLSYYGGKVLSNVRVVMVLYGGGTYASYVTNTAAPSMNSFYQQVVQSSYLDWLCEYSTPSQNIGRGSYAGLYPITPQPQNDGSTIEDGSVQAELALQFSQGLLPAPDSNTLYLVHFPQGKVVSWSGLSTCVDFCSYHSTAYAGTNEYFYAVLPDNSPGSGCDSGCSSTGSRFDDLCTLASHELIESITDPEVGLTTVDAYPLAWYDACDIGASYDDGEVADICNNCLATFVGSDHVVYTVEKGFSNLANDCIASRSVTAPLANSQTLTNQQGKPITLTLSGADSNTCSRRLSYSVTVNPAHGTLSGTAPALIYTPVAAFTGHDTFQFKVNNGVLDSSPATVNLWLVPTVLGIARLHDGNMLLTVATAPNTSFTLQTTDYLTNPPPWANLLQSNAGPSGTLELSDLLATNHSQRLYRAVVP